MAFRGLARIPRRIARQLSEAAHSCALAAAALEATARAGADPRDAMEAATEAEQASHRAALSSARMLGGGVDREDVMLIARSLQTLGRRLEQAAFALGLARGEPAPWQALVGVVRDATREVAAAIDGLDGPATVRDAHLDRADELHGEWRERYRPARAGLLTASGALAAEMSLCRLEDVELACRRAARAVRTVAIKHA